MPLYSTKKIVGTFSRVGVAQNLIKKNQSGYDIEYKFDIRLKIKLNRHSDSLKYPLKAINKNQILGSKAH